MEDVGLMLEGSFVWFLTPPAEAKVYFRSLNSILPCGCILYFEGLSIAENVAEFFRSKQPTKIRKVAINTLWPEPFFYHVEANEENLESLAELLNDHTEDEICDHFHIYDMDGMLVYWHDAFSDNQLVFSHRFDEEEIRRFCSLIGSEYHKEP